MKAFTMAIACVFVASSVAAQTGSRNDSSPVIVQMSYYAQPGMDDEVLRLRLLAAEVLVKRGLNRGRVWQSTESPRAAREPGPTVIWQGEFPNEAMLKQYEEVADNDPDFLSIRRQMGKVTVAARTERRYYREAR